MAINFPDSPSNGDTHTANGVVYTYNSTSTLWDTISGGGGGSSVTVSDTAPTSPSDGDQWFDSADGSLSVYYNDGSSSQWISTSGPAGVDGTNGTDGTDGASGSSVTSYANFAAFPSSGNTVGDMGFATDTKAIYVWDGTEWDRIYSGPQEVVEWVTASNSSYTMLIGGASTTISVSATDPDGFGITYGYLTNPSNPSSATVVQGTGANTNDFVITPDASTTGNFSLRITANDGVSKISTVSAIAVNNAALLTGLTGGTGGGAGATTYTAPDGMVVTAQYGVYSSAPNYYMSNLFNGNHSTGATTDYWLSSSGSTGYLEFDLSNHTVSSANISYIQKVIIYPWARSDTFTNITSIEWSNDNGTTWTQSHGDQGWTSSVAVGYNETFLIEQDATHFRLGMQYTGSWGHCLHEVQIYAG
jgi:hypothetical protein